MEASLALRKANQNTSAAARFAKVPPASTRRESNVLDQATVVSTPEVAPVSKATSPCPTPSCRMFVRMPATMLIEQIVGTSSAPGDRCLCCKAAGDTITLASFIPLLPRCYRAARNNAHEPNSNCRVSCDKSGFPCHGMKLAILLFFAWLRNPSHLEACFRPHRLTREEESEHTATCWENRWRSVALRAVSCSRKCTVVPRPRSRLPSRRES